VQHSQLGARQLGHVVVGDDLHEPGVTPQVLRGDGGCGVGLGAGALGLCVRLTYSRTRGSHCLYPF
jgi:hypothetical protein